MDYSVIGITKYHTMVKCSMSLSETYTWHKRSNTIYSIQDSMNNATPIHSITIDIYAIIHFFRLCDCGGADWVIGSRVESVPTFCMTANTQLYDCCIILFLFCVY